ncbi:MAG: S1 RNA-binding domain-containing protein [Synergistaceae bacterium]|nr:S1 RNA-binding domain-containing protein [Synergistaceae bacterium]
MGEADILSVGEIVDCTVEQIMPYGAFVRIAKNGRKGMIHISELSYSFVKNISDVLNIGDKVQAKVIKIDERGRIDLSIKQTQPQPQAHAGGFQHRTQRTGSAPSRPSRPSGRDFTPREGRPPREREFRDTRDFRAMQETFRETSPEEADTFEKKMASFLKTSEAKITDLNTRNSSRSGRPSRRRQGGRDY